MSRSEGSKRERRWMTRHHFESELATSFSYILTNMTIIREYFHDEVVCDRILHLNIQLFVGFVAYREYGKWTSEPLKLNYYWIEETPFSRADDTINIDRRFPIFRSFDDFVAIRHHSEKFFFQLFLAFSLIQASLIGPCNWRPPTSIQIPTVIALRRIDSNEPQKFSQLWYPEIIGIRGLIPKIMNFSR